MLTISWGMQYSNRQNLSALFFFQSKAAYFGWTSYLYWKSATTNILWSYECARNLFGVLESFFINFGCDSDYPHHNLELISRCQKYITFNNL